MRQLMPSMLSELGLPVPPENRPGRVLSAYNAFVRENLKTFKNQSDPTGTEGQAGLAKAFKACGEAWRELPASEKQKYLEPASKLREEAREAYHAYLSQLTRKDFKRINEALPASARLVRPRGSSRPDGVRKPAGAFTLFCKDHTVKSGGPNMSQQTSELSVKWRAMGDEEKEVSEDAWRPPLSLSRFVVLIASLSLT